ncbi:hypothetical protein pipiens_011979 [Culex pipiens pipiens]|uniref:BED-type domain-containing protein n=1 Tax=Culex pipiens pipiens TaxID=38569 RepID=A0ABD1D468_CULPP
MKRKSSDWRVSNLDDLAKEFESVLMRLTVDEFGVWKTRREYQSWTTISTRSVGPGRGGKEDRNVRCEECDKPYVNRSSKLVNVQAHIKTAFGIKIALSAQRWKSTPR